MGTKNTSNTMIIHKFICLITSYLCSFIHSILGPQRYFFLPSSDIDNCSTNFFSMIKLFSNHCQQLIPSHSESQKPQRIFNSELSYLDGLKTYCIQPRGIRFPSSKGCCPLPSISTNRILPFRLYIIFKTIKVCSHSQLAWMMNIIVNTAHRINYEAHLSVIPKKIPTERK